MAVTPIGVVTVHRCRTAVPGNGTRVTHFSTSNGYVKKMEIV